MGCAAPGSGAERGAGDRGERPCGGRMAWHGRMGGDGRWFRRCKKHVLDMLSRNMDKRTIFPRRGIRPVQENLGGVLGRSVGGD